MEVIPKERITEILMKIIIQATEALETENIQVITNGADLALMTSIIQTLLKGAVTILMIMITIAEMIKV